MPGGSVAVRRCVRRGLPARSLVALLAALAVAGCSSTWTGETGPPDPPHSVPARALPPPTRDPAPATAGPDLRRGVNVTRWFRFPGEDSDAYLRDYLTDAELVLLVRHRVSHVRLNVAPEVLAGPAGAGPPSRRVLRALDRAVARLTAHGLAVVLDLHDEHRLYERPHGGDHLVALWRALARHFHDLPVRSVAYELLNEPIFEGRAADWATLQSRLVHAVREVDPARTLVVTGADWGSPEGLQALSPLPDRNLVYSYHFYEPHAFTHQGADWEDHALHGLAGLPYPVTRPGCDAARTRTRSREAREVLDEYCAQGWDASRVWAAARSMQRWGDRHHVRLYAGELGAYCLQAPRDARLRWLHDTLGAVAAHGDGWAVWGYDDCFALGVSAGTDAAPGPHALDQDALALLDEVPA